MTSLRGKENYRKNHGVPGVVYILGNPGLREGLYKIGCSRISGYKRAHDLNNDANTGTPGTFRCIFEYRTKNCGKAEERVFKKLSNHRQGKWGQEFFSVDLEVAKATIINVCKEVDTEADRIPPPAKQIPPISTRDFPDFPSNRRPPFTKEPKKNRFFNSRIVKVISLILVFMMIVNWHSADHQQNVAEPQNKAHSSHAAPAKPVHHGFVPSKKAKKLSLSDRQTPKDITSTNSSPGTPRHQFVGDEEVDYQLGDVTSEEFQWSATDSPPSEPEVQMTKVEIENLKTCLDGRYKTLCKYNLLTAEQSSQAADAERSANLKSCLDGRYPALCDHQSLTASESANVDQAERRASLKSCIDGRYPILCNVITHN